ncbi:MAG: asparagine synthetase B, partial [Ruminococcus sp.]|nr:asparagine synthetase B [Ruminococcus sp.]
MTEIKTYRGHIRNHKALCEELGLDDSLHRAERELAILKAGFDKWGKKLPDHIYGMFAFAVYDSDTDTLTCFRDQFGTKPFYYYLTADGRLLYGTMIRDIISQKGFVRELNESMLQIYLTLTYVAGEDTFFKGLKKLMPGCLMEFKDGKLTIERYWKPTFAPDRSKSVQDYADEINETMEIIMQEVKEPNESADSFLSGGVDSAYVLAVSDAQMTHCCGYEEERFDESRVAKVTADTLGRDFGALIVKPEDFFGIVHYTMLNMEQPLGDASAIVFTLGCNETAKTSKLCYSGEGSDEFFGGYNMYRNAEHYGDNLKTFYVGNTNIMKEEEKERLLLNYDPSV